VATDLDEIIHLVGRARRTRGAVGIVLRRLGQQSASTADPGMGREEFTKIALKRVGQSNS
jgi:hypothetical protein